MGPCSIRSVDKLAVGVHHTYRLLIIAIGGCNYTRNRALGEDEVKPVQVRFICVCRGLTIWVEGRRTTRATEFSICRFRRRMGPKLTSSTYSVWEKIFQLYIGCPGWPVEHSIGKLRKGWCYNERNQTCLHAGIGLVVPSAVHLNGREARTNGISAEPLEEGLLCLSASFV